MAKPLKVIDFNAKEFDEFLNQIFKNEQFKADNVLILGIEDGGKPLAQLTFEFLSNHFENSDFHLKFVKSQRPSTKVKKRKFIVEKHFKINFSHIA